MEVRKLFKDAFSTFAVMHSKHRNNVQILISINILKKLEFEIF